MKKLIPLLLILALLSGCFPLKNELVEHTGDAQNDNPVLTPEDTDAGTLRCELYYQYGSETLLSSEMAELSLEHAANPEVEILQALIEGPSTDSTRLHRVINSKTQVLSVELIDNIYYVTLTDDFLEPIQGLPDGWRNSTTWPALVRNAQQLAAYSVVQTLLCRGTAARVQFLIAPNAQSQGIRPTRGEMGFGEEEEAGLKMEPLAMDLTRVLRPETVVNSLLKAVKNQDWSSVETFIAADNRPERAKLMNLAAQEPETLESYTLIRTQVSPDGSGAVVTVHVSMNVQDGSLVTRENLPLRLLREQDGWTVTWESLQLLWMGVLE